MSVLLPDEQARALLDRLNSDDKEMRDAARLMAEATRAFDDMDKRLMAEAARANAAERRAVAAEQRAEELADQNIELKLRLAEYETATQPPAVA